MYSTVLLHLPPSLLLSSPPPPPACQTEPPPPLYCPLPAGLPPFATAVKASVKERETEKKSLKLGRKPGRILIEHHNRVFCVSRHSSAAFRHPPVVPLFRSHRLDFIIRPARW